MTYDELAMLVCGLIIGAFAALMLSLLAISTETERQADERRQ